MPNLNTPEAEAPETETAPTANGAGAPETASWDDLRSALRGTSPGATGTETPTTEDESAETTEAETPGTSDATGEESEVETETESDPQAETATETAPDEEDDDAPKPGEDPETNSPRQIRLNPKRFNTPEQKREFAALTLMNQLQHQGVEITFAEAYRRTHGHLPGATPEAKADAAETKPAAEVEKAPTPSAKVEALQAEVDALEAEYLKHADNVDTAEMAKTQIKLNRKSAELGKAQAELENTQRTAAQAFEARVSESFTAASEDFPDLLNDDAPLTQASNAEIQRLQKENPAFFNDPAWPEMVVALTARRLKIAPKSVTATPPAVAATKPATAKTGTPAKPTPAKPAAVVKPPVKVVAARSIPAPAPGGRGPGGVVTSDAPVSIADVRAALREAEKVQRPAA